MSQKTVLLLIVHPGSACGSADFNLGPALARSRRDLLVRDITAWKAGVIVVDGELSDELKDYPDLAQALRKSLTQARRSGHVAGRFFACDNLGPSMKRTLPRYLQECAINPEQHRFELTGCWTSHGQGSGCVDDACNILRRLGFSASVRDSAVAE